MDRFVKEKIRNTLDAIRSNMQRTVEEKQEVLYYPCGYKKPEEMPGADAPWQTFNRYDRAAGRDAHFWFKMEIDTPEAGADEEFQFELLTGREGQWDATNPQGLLYLNGEIAQGLDTNHTRCLLKAGGHYDVLVYYYTNMSNTAVELRFNVVSVNKRLEKLYYDMKVPYDAALCCAEDDYIHISTIKCLEHACNMIDLRAPKSETFMASCDAADAFMKEEYYGKMCGHTDAVVSYIGHTHIDVAWLWTLDQTKEKVQRTFSTVLNLMDRYPEYVFMSSQPQLYSYLKKEEPKLYERVKQKVKEGRWEVEGAMWLEADCNLSSGESFVRQILHGKEFMRNEFGVESHILWLPDVFGYSAALPQVLKKSGVDTFVTSKIGWNETNQMPVDAFLWEGIDGTEIFSYFLTAQNHSEHQRGSFYTTYVGTISPQMNLGTWERFQQKDYGNETIVTFGFGDGGGGPTAEMLEAERRLEYGLPGQPKAQMSFAGDFLARLKKNFYEGCEYTGRTPKWVGELYLEYHRGTYTSAARNKKNNRECEFLCQTTETLSVLDTVLNGGAYPHDVLHESWETILLNQFHDIIPGSSIMEVYEESRRQYAVIRENVGAVKADKLTALADGVCEAGTFVYNPNSFPVSGYVSCDGKTVYAENVPALGWRVVKEEAKNETAVSVSDHCIESAHYKILFDENMNIVSLFDKDNSRETVEAGKAANRLCAFEDYPRAYENWELSSYYKQKMYPVNDVTAVKPVSGAGFAGFEITRKYMNSTICQTVKVYDDDRRIDVENNIDWHESHVLLKSVFPTNVHANRASYEIQFGNVERPTHQNTSWDAAKFEVCAHKWADLSEEGYGLSILNNCKYGHSVSGSEMTITMIKCGVYPNTENDHGVHLFTYSFYPHAGDFRHGGTIEEAYKLNRPLEAAPAKGCGRLPASYSLVSADCGNVIVETVKQAEDGRGIVVRMYEAWNKKSDVTLTFGFDAKKIFLCDLMENKTEEIGSGNTVCVPVSNFEIVTLYIEL